MQPLQAIRSGWSQYANFSRRATRPEFWWWYLLTLIVQFTLYLLGFFIGALAAPSTRDTAPTSASVGIFAPILFVIWIGVMFALFLPSLAVFFRRLHDTDRSGWRVFIGCIPFGGLVLLILCVLEGHRSQNAYGPPPGTPGDLPPDLGIGPYASGEDATSLQPTVPGPANVGSPAMAHTDPTPRPQWRRDLPRMPVPRLQLAPDVRDAIMAPAQSQSSGPALAQPLRPNVPIVATPPPLAPATVA
jgi:uncharacterized membrane protein YhaH (DUF805 family)